MARPELRQMLERGEMVLAPAVWDAITERLMRHMGFKVLYTPGSGTGVVVGEGEPLITITEKAMVAERVSEGVDDELPVIVDIECGYGNPVHIQSAIRTLEDAGATAIHIEDQLYPQRVSYFRGIEHVVSLEEYQQRVEYAVKARKSKDFLIIARNDVYHSVEGEGDSEAAVKRAQAALEVGADAIFITGMKGREDMEYFRRAVPDVPMTMVAGTTGPTGMPVDGYKSMGYQILLYIFTIQASLRAIHDTYKSVKESGYLPTTSQDDLQKFMGLTNTLLEFEEKWAVESATTEAQQS